MLKQARLQGGIGLRNFEAMDIIHERMRRKADEGLTMLEPIIRKNLHSLVYEKKADLYSLHLEKKRLDDLNIEKLIAGTKVPENLLTQHEEELKKIISDYKINVHGQKMPYSMKIKQICAHMSAFYNYKKDQREMLDFSVVKSKEYQDQQKLQFLDLKVFIKVDLFGEKSLTPEEAAHFERLMLKDIDENSFTLS